MGFASRLFDEGTQTDDLWEATICRKDTCNVTRFVLEGRGHCNEAIGSDWLGERGSALPHLRPVPF